MRSLARPVLIGAWVLIVFAGRMARGAADDLDADGLLDDWETGRVHPGGLDLKALGCRPGRQDAIVEIERFEDVDFPRLRDNMDRAVRYFADLPVRNRD